MFAESVYSFLDLNYSDRYFISSRDVRIVDVMTNVSIDYQMVIDGEIPSLLLSTLDDIIKLKNSTES